MAASPKIMRRWKHGALKGFTLWRWRDRDGNAYAITCDRIEGTTVSPLMFKVKPMRTVAGCVKSAKSFLVGLREYKV